MCWARKRVSSVRAPVMITVIEEVTKEEQVNRYKINTCNTIGIYEIQDLFVKVFSYVGRYLCNGSC